MRKRDKLRAKRDRAWEKMEDRHSQKKAEAGICMIIVMFFTMGIMATCAPDLADAKSRSSSRSTKSYSAPKVRKAPVRKAPIVRKAPVKKAPISLSKKKVIVGVGAGVVTGAVVTNQLNKDKQNKQKSTVKRTTPRKLKKGMYEKNGKICKVKYGREKCKSKAAYFYDDVLDADDWFEDDDDDEEQYTQQRQHQPQQQSSPFTTLMVLMWLTIMIFAVLVVLFFVKRRK